MMRPLRPYSAYKDSGVEWMGKVPAHWDVRRVRTIASVVNGATPSSNVSSYWGGDIVWVTPQDLGALASRYVKTSARTITRDGYESCGATIVPAGSVAISTRAPIGHTAIFTAEACTNQGCRVLVPNDLIQADHLFYSLKVARPELESLGQGTTFSELSRDQLCGFPLSLPPLPEQATIVRYLDHTARRIRRCIRAKQKLITLLEEQKQAIIHQAVTGQIDVRTGQPYPAYKPSRVEWLEDVPEHWEVRRLKSKLRPVDRRSSSGTETLLSLRRDFGVVVYAEHFSRPPQGVTLVGYKLVEAGQLVVNRLQANNGLLFCSRLSGVVSPDYSVFAARPPVDMEYLGNLLRTVTYKTHFRRESTGLGTGSAGFLRLYDDRLLETPVALPPLEEQSALLVSLSEITASLCRAIGRQHVGIALLREYSTRLIADVVTGKLDVREAAERLPEVDPLADEFDALTTQATETGVMELEDATELP